MIKCLNEIFVSCLFLFLKQRSNEDVYSHDFELNCLGSIRHVFFFNVWDCNDVFLYQLVINLSLVNLEPLGIIRLVHSNRIFTMKYIGLSFCTIVACNFVLKKI